MLTTAWSFRPEYQLRKRPTERLLSKGISTFRHVSKFIVGQQALVIDGLTKQRVQLASTPDMPELGTGLH
jgi:hypothetical protein